MLVIEPRLTLTSHSLLSDSRFLKVVVLGSLNILKMTALLQPMDALRLGEKITVTLDDPK